MIRKMLAFILLGSSTAWAGPRETLIQASPAATARWQTYFASVPKLPDPHGTLSSLLKVPAACRARVDQIYRWVDEYGFASFNSDADKADSSRLKIEKLLRDLEKKKDPCFDTVAGGYVTASVMLLDYYDFNFSMAAAYTPEKVRMSTSIAMNLLATFLFNEGAISIVTEDFRKNEPGELWRKRTKSGKAYDIVGAYGCGGARIFIDPFQPPINLGSIMAHEIGHLFRDKFVTPELESEAGLDARSGILADETLSTLTSAFHQRRLLDSIIPQRKKGFWIFKRWERFEAFRVRNDITLFRPDGPLNRLWQSLDGELTALLHFPQFLERTFLRKDSQWKPLPPRGDAAMREIWDVVSDAYFEKPLSYPDTDRLPRTLDPLGLWLETNKVDVVVYEDGKYPENTRDWFTRFHWIGTAERNPTVPLFRFNAFFDALDDLKPRLKLRSASCDRFHEQVGKNELDDYIGRALGPLKGQEGGRPGPGQDGGRPSTPLMPCFNFNEAL